MPLKYMMSERLRQGGGRLSNLDFCLPPRNIFNTYSPVRAAVIPETHLRPRALARSRVMATTQMYTGALCPRKVYLHTTLAVCL